MGRNGGPQRKPREREYHRHEIIKRYLVKHQSQREIAEGLGVSQQLVSSEIRAALREWQRTTKEDLGILLAEQLERLSLIERECWAGWRRSRRDKVTVVTQRGRDRLHVTQSYRVGDGEDENEKDGQPSTSSPESLPYYPSPLVPLPAPANTKIVRYSRTSRLGDVRFLRQIQGVISMRVRLLGLTDPHRVIFVPQEITPEAVRTKPFIWVRVSSIAHKVITVAIMRNRLARLLSKMQPGPRTELINAFIELGSSVERLNKLITAAEEEQGQSPDL